MVEFEEAAATVEVISASEHEEQTELDSATLARLLDEVRNDEPSEPHAYNRMHNRHNR